MSKLKIGNYSLERKDFYTLPNLLCYLRILLVPAFVSLYLVGMYSPNNSNRLLMEYLGLGCVVLASLCDFADGKIARKFNQITEVGKFLDPLADKIMQCAVAVVACIGFDHISGLHYMWFLLGVFIFKEIFQFLVILFIFHHGNYMDGAKWYGKVATFGFDVLMLVILVLPVIYPDPSQDSAVFQAMVIMIVISFLLLIFSFIMYMIECFRLYNSGVNNIPDSLYPEWEKKYGSRPGAVKKKETTMGEVKND